MIMDFFLRDEWSSLFAGRGGGDECTFPEQRIVRYEAHARWKEKRYGLTNMEKNGSDCKALSI